MTGSPSPLAVSPADIDAAAKVLAPYAVRTPLLSSPAIDAMTGARVLFKAEVLQRTGSFKFRGAFNKMSLIPPAARAGGVVAFSSGNHAQGVAAAAQILKMPATIVMPADAPTSKRERTKGYGAEVVLYDREREDREVIARDIAAKRGATLVPPYDDAAIIAGQGTVGREIAEDLTVLDILPDVVIAPASGGGLVAGVATAIKARFPRTAVMTAEPEGFDDHARSLRSGKREPHLQVQGVVTSDREVGVAIATAFRELKLVVEPGGVVGLAALLAGRFEARGNTVVVVLSGGNVDADLFARLIS